MAAGDVQTSIPVPQAFPCNVFDGVDDYVEIPHNAAQLGANLSNGFTISAWINPRSVGETEGAILDKSSGVNGANGFNLKMNSTQAIRFDPNPAGTVTSANSSVLYGVWTHVILTVTSEDLIKFYCNGIISGAGGTILGTIAQITTTNVMRIGNRSGGTDRTFDGSIRHVKMWNRVLTAAEITADYQGAVNTTGLIHHFKLGGDYKDYGFVGATATNSGSLATATDGNVAALMKASRTGATDKYLADEVNGKILFAVMNET